MARRIKKPTRFHRAIVASMLLLAVAAPAVATADSPADFVIPNGHFYTQTNGFPAQTSLRGYAIADEDGIPFWTKFENLGGTRVLGYPVSQRLPYQEQVIQLTQRVVLAYDASLKRVHLIDVFDFLSRAGRDGWLAEKAHIPPPVASANIRAPLGTPGESAALLRLLEQSPPIKRYYDENPEVSAILGLPTSDLHKLEEYEVMRFQKGALQLWKVNTASSEAGQITVVNAGDLLKESGLLPAGPMDPHEPPESVVRRARLSNRDRNVTRGIATWYGSDFHGLEMRNGETYDMYDPSTTASNIHPIGAMLLVTSAKTGEAIEVRVTDTGAFRYPIVVDLSWAAFKKLANPAEGIAEVFVERIGEE